MATLPNVPANVLAEVVELASDGCRVQAIRVLMGAMGWTLRDARGYLEAIGYWR